MQDSIDTVRELSAAELDQVGGGLGVGLTVGLGVDDQSGLAAGVLFLVIFTVWFSASFILRPFDTHQPST